MHGIEIGWPQRQIHTQYNKHSRTQTHNTNAPIPSSSDQNEEILIVRRRCVCSTQQAVIVIQMIMYGLLKS